MTIEELQTALARITGKDAISKARRRAIIAQICALEAQRNG